MGKNTNLSDPNLMLLWVVVFVIILVALFW